MCRLKLSPSPKRLYQNKPRCRIWFLISDLHLAPERPQIIKLFLRFCDEVAAQADTLYILGDFLEYWLGDDDPSPALTPVFDKLAALSEKHKTRIVFMHGNRDFLVGNKLAKRCHFELIENDTFKIKNTGSGCTVDAR